MSAGGVAVAAITVCVVAEPSIIAAAVELAPQMLMWPSQVNADRLRCIVVITAPCKRGSGPDRPLDR